MRSLLRFSWLVLIGGVIIGYSLYLDNYGVIASGRVSEKRESIWVHSGDWTRRCLLIVRFQVPGEILPRYADGDVDVVTYDRTRVGDAMQVRYIPSPVLHQIVLVPTARLAIINTFSLPGDYAPIEHGLAVIILLACLLALAVKANSRVAGILFVVLGALAFGYFLFPRQLPPPEGTVESARATVSHISTVSRFLSGRRKRGIATSQPYDIVQLKFTPRGRTESVIGVDQIDHDSIPDLSVGDTLPIQYQSDQPRVVRIMGGLRSFAAKARLTFLVNSIAMFLLLAIFHWIGSTIRAKANRMLNTAQSRLTTDLRNQILGSKGEGRPG